MERAQLLQTCHVAHGWWDGAGKLVIAEVAVGEEKGQNECGARVAREVAYSSLIFVRLPKEDGIVPLSWLPPKWLRKRTVRLSA